MLDTFLDAIIDVVVEFSTGTTCTSVFAVVVVVFAVVVVVVVVVVVFITLPQDIIISSVCIWW